MELLRDLMKPEGCGRVALKSDCWSSLKSLFLNHLHSVTQYGLTTVLHSHQVSLCSWLISGLQCLLALAHQGSEHPWHLLPLVWLQQDPCLSREAVGIGIPSPGLVGHLEVAGLQSQGSSGESSMSLILPIGY